MLELLLVVLELELSPCCDISDDFFGLGGADGLTSFILLGKGGFINGFAAKRLNLNLPFILPQSFAHQLLSCRSVLLSSSLNES